MADDKSLDIRLLNSKKFDEFLRTLSSEDQEKVFKADTISDFAQAISGHNELSLDQAVEMFDARKDWTSIKLENAKWFANELGKLSHVDQGKILKATNVGDIRQIYGADAERVWNSRSDWYTYSDQVEIPAPRTEHLPPSSSVTQGSTAMGADSAGLGAAGALGTYDYFKNRKYNSFKKEAEKYAKEGVEKWKNNPDHAYAKSEQGAYNRGINEYNNKFLSDNPEQATKWAKQYNDASLQKAMRKKEILDKPNPRRDKKELDDYLAKHGINNPPKTHAPSGDIAPREVDERLKAAAAIGLAQNATPEAVAENLSRLQANANTAPDETQRRLMEATEIGKTKNVTPEATADYLERIKREASLKNQSSSGLITPNQLQSTQQASHLPPGTPNVTGSQLPSGNDGSPPPKRRRRGAGALGFAKSAGSSALNYLFNLIGKSSVLSALSGLISAGISAIGTAVTAIIGAISGLFAAIAAAAATLGTSIFPILIVIAAVALAVAVAAVVIFGACNVPFVDFLAKQLGICPSDYVVTVPANPPGVTTVKTGPSQIANNGTITYKIVVTYDPIEASATPISQLSLFDVPLFEHEFVSATGNPTPNRDSSGDSYYSWSLSANQTSLTDYSFEFFLTVRPIPENFTVVNAIYVSDIYKPVTITYGGGGGGGGGGGPGGGSPGGGSAPTVSCESGNYRACLQNQFNVRILGNPTNNGLQAVYRGFRLFSGYTTFYNLFRRANITITFASANERSDGAWAVVDTSGNMTLYRNIFSSSTAYQNYFFVHEPAHVIDDYLNREKLNFYQEAYTQGRDRNCFDQNGILKTYGDNVLGSSPALERKINESWADAVSNTVLCEDNSVCPSNGGGGTSIPDFPDSCSYIYGFMMRVLN